MLNTSRRFSTLEYSNYHSRYDTINTKADDDKTSVEVHQKVAQIRSRSRSICSVPIAEPTLKKNHQSHHQSSFMALTASSKAKTKQTGKNSDISINRKEATPSPSVTTKLKKTTTNVRNADSAVLSRKSSTSSSTRRASSYIRPSSTQQNNKSSTHDHACNSNSSMMLPQSKPTSARTVTQAPIGASKKQSTKSPDNTKPNSNTPLRRKKECCPTDDDDVTHKCASPVTINFFESDSDEDELFETSKYKQDQIKKKTSQSAIQSRRQSVSAHDATTKSDLLWEELNDLRDRLDTLETVTTSNKTSPAIQSLDYPSSASAHTGGTSPIMPQEEPISYPNRQLKKAFEQFQAVINQPSSGGGYSVEENVSKRIITDAFSKVVQDTILINQAIWQSIPQDLNMNAPALIELQKNSDMQVSALADAFQEMSKLSFHQQVQQQDIPDYMYSQYQYQQPFHHHQQQQQQQQHQQYTYRKSALVQSPPLQPRHSTYLETNVAAAAAAPLPAYSQKRYSNPYLHFSSTSSNQYMPESSSSNYHTERREHRYSSSTLNNNSMKSPPLGYPRNIRVAGILKPKSPSNVLNRSSRTTGNYPYHDEVLYNTGDESRSSSSDYQDYYPLTPPSRPFESNSGYHRPYIPCPP